MFYEVVKRMPYTILLIQEDTPNRLWFIAYQGNDQLKLADKMREYRGWPIKLVHIP